MMKDVTDVRNSTFYRPEHEHIEQLQDSLPYRQAFANVQEIENEYITKVTQLQYQYQHSINNNNINSNNNSNSSNNYNDDEMISTLSQLKMAKENKINQVLESQSVEIGHLVRATFFAAECRLELLNKFDLGFSNPLKNEWNERKGDILNGLSQQDKDNIFWNEYPLLLIRKQELNRDVNLVAYLVYFGTYLHILDLRNESLNGVLECCRKEVTLKFAENMNTNNKDNTCKNNENTEDEARVYFINETEKLFYRLLIVWIDTRLNEIMNESNDGLKQNIDHVLNQQNSDFLSQFNIYQQQEQNRSNYRMADNDQASVQQQHQHHQEQQQTQICNDNYIQDSINVSSLPLGNLSSNGNGSNEMVTMILDVKIVYPWLKLPPIDENETLSNDSVINSDRSLNPQANAFSPRKCMFFFLICTIFTTVLFC